MLNKDINILTICDNIYSNGKSFIIKNFILSFFAISSIFLLITQRQDSGGYSYNTTSTPYNAVIIFIILAFMYFNFLNNLNLNLFEDKYKFTALCVSFLFSFSLFFSKELLLNDQVDWAVINIIYGVICILGSVIFIFPILLYAIHKYAKFNLYSNNLDKPDDSRKYIFKIWFIITIAWLPWFMALFPGNMATDVYSQFSQIKFNNFQYHSPIFHTAILKLFYDINENYIHNLKFTISLITLMQIIFGSFVFAYSLNILKRLNIKNHIMIFILCFYIFMPLFPLYSIMLNKDYLATISFFATILLCIEYKLFDLSKYKKILLILCIILSILLNKTMIYTTVLLSVCVLCYMVIYKFTYIKNIILRIINNRNTSPLYTNEYRKIMNIFMFICISFYASIQINKITENFYLENFKEQEGKEQIAARATSIIPIVQIYYAYIQNPDSFSEYDQQRIASFIDLNQAKYQSDFADTILQHAQYNEYIMPLWFKHLFFNLDNYIDAFLQLNRQYWDINIPLFTKHEPAYPLYTEQNRDIKLFNNNFNLDFKDNIMHTKISNFFFALQYRYSILQILFYPSLYFWLYIFMCIFTYKQKNKLGFLMNIWIMLHILTYFLGPIAQMRYILIALFSAPFLLVINKIDDIKCN